MKTSTRIVSVVCALASLGTLAAWRSYPGVPKWPLSGGFHYIADLNTTSFVPSGVWDTQAQYALSDWRDSGSTSFSSGFYRLNSDFTNHGNGISSWAWQNRPAEVWLGITFVRWSGSTLVDCDMWFNSRPDYTWAAGLFDPTATRSYWPVDFRSVARHEVGHAIGIEHEDATLASMNSTYQHGAGVAHAAGSGMLPHADDKAACRYLYAGSGTTVNLMATSWREPATAAGGARLLDASGYWSAGNSYNVPVWLANQSNTTVYGGSGGVRVGFYLSTNTTISTSDTRIGEYYFTGNWNPHAASLYTTLGGTVPNNLPAGTYYVGTIFDNTSLVAEQFETDNAALLGTITVSNSTRSLSVQSTNPSSGVSISVSPTDSNGYGTGTTSFTRSFWNSQLVTLTAPATYNGAPFKRWRLDGYDQQLGVTTLQVTMSAAHAAIADYYVRTAGSFTEFGTGCLGSNNQVPAHRATAPKGYPYIGDTTTYVLSGTRANTGAVLYIGASRTAWGSVPLPLPLAAIGIPGCTLYVSPDASLSVSTSSSGGSTLPIAIPANPGLIGASLFTQFAVLDPGSPYAIPVAHTNAVAHRIGGDL